MKRSILPGLRRSLVPVLPALLLPALGAPLRAQDLVGTFPSVVVPPGNPMTPGKILLGKALFFEEQMSSDDTMACATCHVLDAGGGESRGAFRHPGADGLLNTLDDEFGSPGVVLHVAGGDYQDDPVFGVQRQVTGRNSPTVIGAAFFNTQFWDRRAGPVFRDLAGQIVLPDLASLENQAVQPPLSGVEMNHVGVNWDQITAKLALSRPLVLATDLPTDLEQFIGDKRGYGPLFTAVFGTPEITRERIGMAIATYERTLVADQTPFDLGTLTARQLQGFDAYQNRALCEQCHPSTNGLFTDGVLQTIHLPNHERTVKTPTLRNVGLRPRFMSSGQFQSLTLVLQHYESQGMFQPQTGDVGAMKDFLENGLTDPRVAARLPPFDRPTLRSELVPVGSNLYGTGTRGSGNALPEILAASPAYLGNPSFRIGVGNALGRGTALLVLSTEPAAPGSSVLGVPLAVDLPAAFLRHARTLSRGGAGDGVATFRAPMPKSPALVGASFYAQWFVRDPGAAQGIAASRGARFDVFTR